MPGTRPFTFVQEEEPLLESCSAELYFSLETGCWIELL